MLIAEWMERPPLLYRDQFAEARSSGFAVAAAA